jgi:hypothetical protein
MTPGWLKANPHRSLGQRPRNAIVSFRLAEGHIHRRLSWMNMAFGQKTQYATRS